MLKNIFCKIMSNEQQREKLNSLEDKNQIYKLFCQNGYTKSFDEFSKEMEVFLNSEESKKVLSGDFGELSEEMLEMVAGGISKSAITATVVGLLATCAIVPSVGAVPKDITSNNKPTGKIIINNVDKTQKTPDEIYMEAQEYKETVNNTVNNLSNQLTEIEIAVNNKIKNNDVKINDEELEKKIKELTKEVEEQINKLNNDQTMGKLKIYSNEQGENLSKLVFNAIAEANSADRQAKEKLEGIIKTLKYHSNNLNDLKTQKKESDEKIEKEKKEKAEKAEQINNNNNIDNQKEEAEKKITDKNKNEIRRLGDELQYISKTFEQEKNDVPDVVKKYEDKINKFEDLHQKFVVESSKLLSKQQISEEELTLCKKLAKNAINFSDQFFNNFNIEISKYYQDLLDKRIDNAKEEAEKKITDKNKNEIRHLDNELQYISTTFEQEKNDVPDVVKKYEDKINKFEDLHQKFVVESSKLLSKQQISEEELTLCKKLAKDAIDFSDQFINNFNDEISDYFMNLIDTRDEIRRLGNELQYISNNFELDKDDAPDIAKKYENKIDEFKDLRKEFLDKSNKLLSQQKVTKEELTKCQNSARNIIDASSQFDTNFHEEISNYLEQKFKNEEEEMKITNQNKSDILSLNTTLIEHLQNISNRFERYKNDVPEIAKQYENKIDEFKNLHQKFMVEGDKLLQQQKVSKEDLTDCENLAQNIIDGSNQFINNLNDKIEEEKKEKEITNKNKDEIRRLDIDFSVLKKKALNKFKQYYGKHQELDKKITNKSIEFKDLYQKFVDKGDELLKQPKVSEGDVTGYKNLAQNALNFANQFINNIEQKNTINKLKNKLSEKFNLIDKLRNEHKDLLEDTDKKDDKAKDEKFDKAKKEYSSSYKAAFNMAGKLLNKEQISDQELTQYENLAQKARDAANKFIQNINRRIYEKVGDNAQEFNNKLAQTNLLSSKINFIDNIEIQKVNGYTQDEIMKNLVSSINNLRDDTNYIPDSEKYFNELQKEMEEYINNDNNNDENKLDALFKKGLDFTIKDLKEKFNEITRSKNLETKLKQFKKLKEELNKNLNFAAEEMKRYATDSNEAQIYYNDFEGEILQLKQDCDDNIALLNSKLTK